MKEPTKLLGESIVHWDAFYRENYQRVFSMVYRTVPSHDEAVRLTDRIFLNLLFNHTELVIDRSLGDLSHILVQICPQLNELDYDLKDRMSSELLEKYYSPN